MSDYNLPKGYLSYSSMNTWKSSKDQFRKKYYSSEPYNLETPYTRFGKEIAETLEDPKATKAHPILSKIPSYDYPEYPLEVCIEGVPIKGFIDSFCTKEHKILEYKTGIPKDGKAPWNPLKVRKHDQLLLYAVCVQELLGNVDPLVQLVWMETEWAEECTDEYFNKKKFMTCQPALRLTGNFEVFDRTIEEWEHMRMRQDIVRIAEEISKDYTLYQQTGDKSLDTLT